MPVKASVVIPAYNRRELLRRTLLSLANQTFPADQFEVVVADDGSTDGTREMVSTLDVPYPLRYVRQPKRGRAAARNAGMRAAAADLIIFLDSDIAVCPEFVQAHVEAHIDTRLVVIGPVICVAALDAPLSSPPRLGDIPTAFFAAGNASVARWHVEEAGMFDESFREYGWEELEIGDRLRDMGLKRVTALRARGYRYCPPPQVSDLDLYLIRELERGRTAVAYFRKHPTFRARARVRLFPPLFWVDRILFPFEWYERPGFRRWLAGLEQRGRGRLLKAAIRFVMHHAYVSGLRQGLRR